MKYGSYEWWLKGKKTISCISKMHLWTSIHLTKIRVIEQRPANKEEHKNIIKSFPENTDNCRCNECRYFRLVSKYA